MEISPLNRERDHERFASDELRDMYDRIGLVDAVWEYCRDDESKIQLHTWKFKSGIPFREWHVITSQRLEDWDHACPSNQPGTAVVIITQSIVVQTTSFATSLDSQVETISYKLFIVPRFNQSWASHNLCQPLPCSTSSSTVETSTLSVTTFLASSIVPVSKGN
jgi:hypothetical protein